MSSKRNAIIVVHGFWDRCYIFNWMSKYLKSRGYVVFNQLNLAPNNGKYGIEALALQLENYINNSTTAEQKIDIVAFSMGGLVARYYIQNLATTLKVERLITISTPHFGTEVAKIFKYKACIQMRPGSLFLNELNSNIDKLKSLKITSIWAKYDTTIIPNDSSRLPFGREIVFPFGIHPFMPRLKKTILEVEKALNDV